MFKTILLLVLATVVCAAPQARIVGGRDVDIVKHHYLVSIRYKSTSNDVYIHKYAGTIYFKRAVITGAQCVVGIKAGEKVTTVTTVPYTAPKCVHHATYSDWTVYYDIAVIIINDVFDFYYPLFKPIKICHLRPANGRLVTLTGWDYQQIMVLRQGHFLKRE
ncbi:trypsin zeta-like [Musca vetustissima]|uniref:trypsin zeta-like n=1 Tax=Musca vetustissima TaxID=27455 RepID=UPI002AB7191E|nr:trypsin zeta-like [Musca vetustissima]